MLKKRAPAKEIRAFSLLAVVFILSFYSTSAQLTPIVDSIPMSDGRKLAADVYIPAGFIQGPAILVQTPYNRLFYRFVGLPLQIGMQVDSSKYVFVFVDWRGFYGSSPAAYIGSPNIGEDGYSCVEWISQQSWSNGKVGTWGASALGRVQFQTAKKNPPHLTCICPLVAGPQYDYTEYFPHGDLRTEYVEQLDGLGFGLSPILMMHTVHDFTWTLTENSNFYPDSIRIPCFMIGGWYDHTIEFMLPFYNAIRSQSPLAVRDQHRLLMGPWVHGGVGSSTAGELSYPNASHRSDSLALEFFDYHLRSIANGWNTSPFVQYYQMGNDAWQSSPAWPPANTVNTNFYFHQNGLIDNLSPVNSTDSLSFNYDPDNPSPTTGGPTLRIDLEQGPYNQADSVESRNDVLIFTTNTLTQDAVMKGNATVHLKVSSIRKDTDFDIRLTDVYPDGRSMLVNDGAMRMRFRNGNTAADTAAMVPGTIYSCDITLPASCITFLAGHKIRVDVTSSNYPRFNRNMNTGGPMYPGNSLDSLVNPVVASNTVYTNSNASSYITLPLVGFTTGVKEIESKNEFEIYPNPAGNEIKINLSEKNNFQIEVLNTLGEILIAGENKRSVNISALPCGMYFLKLIREDKFSLKKFIKQ